MAKAIVDTNVALVANGSCEGVSPICRLAAMDFLESFMHKGVLVVDLAGAVEEEYRTRLGVGNPGVGNRFLQKFFVEAANRVSRVDIAQDKTGNYHDFPATGDLKNFDKSDRKFAALAVKTGAPVYNATDSDWIQCKDALGKAGVKINFICGLEKSGWFNPK